MKNIIYAVHGILYRCQIPYIPDKEANFPRRLRHFGLKLMAHIVLLLFISGKDTNFLNIRIQETVEYGITERTSTTSNHQSFVSKDTHNLFLLPPTGLQ